MTTVLAMLYCLTLYFDSSPKASSGKDSDCKQTRIHNQVFWMYFLKYSMSNQYVLRDGLNGVSTQRLGLWGSAGALIKSQEWPPPR